MKKMLFVLLLGVFGLMAVQAQSPCATTYFYKKGHYVQLEARPMNPGNYTFLWSNGYTTQVVDIFENGDYCVTVTNTDAGCTTAWCFPTIESLPDCITLVEKSPGQYLRADPRSGVAPFSYLWNTGATTASIAPSQPGYYRVTTTDANGCTSVHGREIDWASAGCTATITYNADNTLTVNSTGVPPFSYQWAPTGETTQTIAPQMQGNYSVVVTDANGCTSLAAQNWYPIDACSVWLSVYNDPDSIPYNEYHKYIHAVVSGNWYDYTFAWSNGDTGPVISTEIGGEYCVTVTNNYTGCTSTACTWVQPDDACSAFIASTAIDLETWRLQAMGFPGPIASYQWSTGATTPFIETSEAGVYGVTVTNSTGCTVSAILQFFEQNQLHVNVLYDGDSILQTGKSTFARLFLIRYDDDQGGILTAVQETNTYSYSTQPFLNAWGSFYNISPGRYLLKAALLPNSYYYDQFLPTYSTSALFWHEAVPIEITKLSPFSYNPRATVTLIPGQNPGGPGFIGGLVSEGANFGGGYEAQRGEGDPMAGISVVLTLPDGTPVTATTTNEDGQFAFNNLAWGTYVVTIDVPGLSPVSTTVTIGPGNPSASNVHFIMDENSIALSVGESLAEVYARVFPNPARDILWVDLEHTADLLLTNADGKVVRQLRTTEPRTGVWMNDLPAGAYFLTVRQADAVRTLLVVKE